MKVRILLIILFTAGLLGAVVLALRDLGVERVEPSTILACIYVAGGLVTFIAGFWLAHRKHIDTPWVLSFLLTLDLMVVLFVALWPIFGLLAIAEIFYRAASRRRRSEISDEKTRHT
jgi:hypothetical protein